MSPIFLTCKMGMGWAKGAERKGKHNKTEQREMILDDPKGQGIKFLRASEVKIKQKGRNETKLQSGRNTLRKKKNPSPSLVSLCIPSSISQSYCYSFS